MTGSTAVPRSDVCWTHLNNTPPGAHPLRRPGEPVASVGRTLPNRTLARDDTLTVDVSRVFMDPDGDALTHAVSSLARG